ncbi:MAG: tRNA lysidine(34) synthetase TilS [Flavobacteriaceae bacterium]|nr:tRNA lysidine(34) synthetase TilS [Flavobacteriaceae bacterium]
MSLKHLKIEDSYPQLKNKKSLLAVSGGVDSIVLSHLFYNTKFKFCIAHCNYNLRGKDSNKDALLVKSLANTLNVDLFLKKFDTIEYSNKNKCSLQMAARDIRYNWFNDLLIENDISYIITAHHLNDQLETFLINISRGSGIDGLIGIPETNKLIRPLLNYTKEEILSYAKENNLKWNEDQSNSKNDYLRNSLRNLVITKWKKIMPDLEKHFQKTIQHLGFASKALNIQIDNFKKKSFINIETGIKIDLKDLNNLSPREFFLHAIFKQYGFIYPIELEKLINSTPGKIIYSDSHELLRDRKCLILRKKLEKLEDTYEIKLIPQKLNIPFHIEISLDPFPNNFSSIEIDPKLVDSPLVIKKNFTGAYFYPVGMTGKKKLSKYFKDEKYSSFQKENQWILTSNNKVVWVIGKRADRRFLASLDTKKRMYICINLT